MRIGAVFPHTEIGNDPLVIRRWAESVEDLGYDHVVAFDHVLGAGTAGRPGWRGYSREHAFHEVLVLFGFLSAVTTSVELVTGILVLPQRQTALVAKQAAEVDVLSGARLRLGVGVGWNEVEYEALGQPFTDRGALVEEQTQLLRAFWSERTLSFSGRWHRVDDAGINPLPRRSIPLWFGGYAEATLRRVGRFGDGWMPGHGGPDETARQRVQRIMQHARRADRDVRGIGLEPRLNVASVPPQEWTGFAAGWRELGATHVSVNTMDLGLSSMEEHIRLLDKVGTVIRRSVS